MQYEVLLEWDAAEVGDAIEPSRAGVSFAPSAFEQTITDGRIVGWLLANELFFEDFDLPDYEGEDRQVDEVQIRSIDATAGTVSIRAVLRIELASTVQLETEQQYRDFYNSVSGAIQIFYWTGEGESPHPEQAVGIFELPGEINYVQINGRVVHERRTPKAFNLVLAPDLDFETCAFTSPVLSEAELVDILTSAPATDFHVELALRDPDTELLSLCFYLSPNCGDRGSKFDVQMGEENTSAKIELRGPFEIPVKSSAVGEVQSLGSHVDLVALRVGFRKFDEPSKTWVRAVAAIAEDNERDCATWRRIANWKLDGT